MALVGLDSVYVAQVTVDDVTGEETYAAPVRIANAIEANITKC
ncbi:MAG: hypothetical protein WBB47_12240 [Paenisporosarcina sp.]